MQRKIYLTLPFIVLFSLFLIDKITLIPAFQNCCIKKGLELFFENSLRDEFPLEDRMKKGLAAQKKIVFVFGSSLSYGFYFTESTEYLNTLNTLDPNQKSKSKDWEIINFATPGATVITHYVRLIQMLNRGVKPDLLLMELAPNSFNPNSPWYNTEIIEAVPLSFALKHAFEIPFVHLRKIVISRIFILSHYKLGKPNQDYQITRNFFKKFIYDYGKEEKLEAAPESFKVGEEKIANAFVNQFLLEMLKLNFTNYSISKDLEVYYHLLIEKAKKENIPIVFWYPALHPSAISSVSKTTTPTTWESFKNTLPQNSVTYIDLNVIPNSCEEFIDPMHMAVSCFARNFPLFLEKLENE